MKKDNIETSAESIALFYSKDSQSYKNNNLFDLFKKN